MANKNVIVVKKPGEIIHANYLARVVKEYTTYMGTALVHDNKLVIHHQKGKPTVDNIMKLQTDETLKALQVIFCFGENPQILDEDMMPFDITVDKATDFHAAVFLEGQFQGYAVPKSTHTNEFHCVDDFLKLKLPKLWKTAGNGVEGFITELNDPLTQKELNNCWAERGFISIMTSAGPAVTLFNKGNVFKSDYNWGITSQSMNYVEKTEAKPAEVKAEAPKELSMLEKLQMKMSGKVPEPVVAKPAELPVETKTATAIADLSAEDWEWVGPAPDQDANGQRMTNAKKSEWWYAEAGYLPEAYKKASCRVKRKKGTKIGLLAPLAAGNVAPVAVAGTGPQPDVKDAATHIKDERPDPKTLPDKKVVELVKDTAPKHVLMDNMPILSPRQKIALKTGWMKDAEVVKTLGDDFSVLAFDPKKLKDFEENFQTFWDGMGMEPRWLSFEAITALFAADPKAAQQLLFNYQNEAFKLRVKLNTIIADPANKIVSQKLAM